MRSISSKVVSVYITINATAEFGCSCFLLNVFSIKLFSSLKNSLYNFNRIMYMIKLSVRVALS